MHEWILITSWIVYPWSLLGSDYRSRSTDVCLLYLFCMFHCFMFILACFLRLIEGESKWGHRSASNVPSTGQWAWPLEEMLYQQFLGKGSAWLYYSLATCSGSEGLSEWHHTLACWQMPSFLPRWTGEEGLPPHTCEQGTQTNWILCPREQKCCRVKLRSMAK